MRVSATALLAGVLAGGTSAYPQNVSTYFSPGNLLLCRIVYNNNPNNVTVGEPLPPNCIVSSGSCSLPVAAINDGTYLEVFNNARVDDSFGITSKIYLDQLTPAGSLVNSLEVSNSSQSGITPTDNQMDTSFSSKSELALNLSTDHQYVTFMGYVAPIDKLDVSNSNTPPAVDPTNPVGEKVYRAVAGVNQNGEFFDFTKTNVHSGNNGRAAIVTNTSSDSFIYTAGNAGNGSTPAWRSAASLYGRKPKLAVVYIDRDNIEMNVEAVQAHPGAKKKTAAQWNHWPSRHTNHASQ
jgi:hypothetical protein